MTGPWLTTSSAPDSLRASGQAEQLVKGLNYIAFLGNGLNTLSIAANKIDTNLLFSGSVWWEPLGHYGPPGKSTATCTMIISPPGKFVFD